MTRPEVGIGIVGYGMMGKAHSYGYTLAPKVRELPCFPRLRLISGRHHDAVTKAADTSAGVCPAQIPRGAQERLVFLEKRLAALREAVHLVVPAFEAFHASLDSEQKARLDSGPRGWRWPRSSGE